MGLAAAHWTTACSTDAWGSSPVELAFLCSVGLHLGVGFTVLRTWLGGAVDHVDLDTAHRRRLPEEERTP